MSIPYAIIFLVLAALAGLVAALAPGWFPRTVGAAGALSFLLVAIAYFGAGPRLLFKRAGGRRHPAAWIVHWPYFALTAFAFRLTVLSYREGPYVRVAPNVFLGRRLKAREAKEAEAEGWLAVLDLAAELSETRRLCKLANYRSQPVLDATATSLDKLREAVEWVKSHAANGPVYGTCPVNHVAATPESTSRSRDNGLPSVVESAGVGTPPASAIGFPHGGKAVCREHHFDPDRRHLLCVPEVPVQGSSEDPGDRWRSIGLPTPAGQAGSRVPTRRPAGVAAHLRPGGGRQPAVARRGDPESALPDPGCRGR